MWKNENAFDSLIDKWAQAFDIPVWVIKATIAKESSFDPSAFNANDPGGSRGLMQVTPATARGLGYKGVLETGQRSGGLFVPDVNIKLGTKLLRELRDRYKTEPWDTIYGYYNAGPGRIHEPHVVGWREAADYFNPNWKLQSIGEGYYPFEQPPAPLPVVGGTPTEAQGTDLRSRREPGLSLLPSSAESPISGGKAGANMEEPDVNGTPAIPKMAYLIVDLDVATETLEAQLNASGNLGYGVAGIIPETETYGPRVILALPSGVIRMDGLISA